MSQTRLTHPELLLRLLHSPDGSRLAPPMLVAVRPGDQCGRNADANVFLDDTSVSRTHARFHREEPRWLVENCSANNGLFVDALPVPPGTRAELPAHACHLQIGGLLFECTPSEGTTPYLEPILERPSSAPDAAREPLVRVRRDGDAATLYVAGRLVPIKPLAALVLFVLAEQPGTVVHEWDILDRLRREAHVSQAISEIRRVFRRLLDDGVLDAHVVRGWVEEASAGLGPETLESLDPAALLRRLVLSRRGHGYALMVPPGCFIAEEDG